MIPIYALLSVMAPPGLIYFLTQPLLPIKYEPEISRSQIDYKCSRKVFLPLFGSAMVDNTICPESPPHDGEMGAF